MPQCHYTVYAVREFSFFLWYYFRCLFVRSFDSSVIFLSFSFVMNLVKFVRYSLLLLHLIAIPYLMSCLTPGLILLRKSTSTKLKSFFFVWCKSRQISIQIPFSAPVVALYFFNLDQQLRSPSSMVLVHAALKWLHSFTPDDCPNPLDNACCRSMIECAKRTRSLPVSKKKPVDAERR